MSKYASDLDFYYHKYAVKLPFYTAKQGHILYISSIFYSKIANFENYAESQSDSDTKNAQIPNFLKVCYDNICK